MKGPPNKERTERKAEKRACVELERVVFGSRSMAEPKEAPNASVVLRQVVSRAP